MTDVILESLRAMIIGSIFFFLFFSRDVKEVRKIDGWFHIVIGFALIFWGTIIDVTDDFESLNRFIIVGDTEVRSYLENVVGYLFGFLFLAIGIWKWLPKIVEQDKQTKQQLNKAIEEVKVLSGLLPICSSCKKIRDDKGYWNQLEAYISKYSEAEFTHGLCPECAKALYPGIKHKK